MIDRQMPLIAIVRCSKLPDYETAIRGAGGDPWIVDPATAQPAEIVARASGLLLTGGGDVDPALYGETRHPTFDPAEPGRDEHEIELARRAMDADLPLLAICRGVQVLNVARGGTLLQDIPFQRPGAVAHKIDPPREPWDLAHEVRIEPDSLLSKVLANAGGDPRACRVNSRHHQALQRLGEGLTAVATAPDGVIEGIEAGDRRFCVGVQWHPENFCRTGEFRSLFEAFVNAAAR